jgi:hypothetical protein
MTPTMLHRAARREVADIEALLDTYEVFLNAMSCGLLIPSDHWNLYISSARLSQLESDIDDRSSEETRLALQRASTRLRNLTDLDSRTFGGRFD